MDSWGEISKLLYGDFGIRITFAYKVNWRWFFLSLGIFIRPIPLIVLSSIVVVVAIYAIGFKFVLKVIVSAYIHAGINADMNAYLAFNLDAYINAYMNLRSISQLQASPFTGTFRIR